jgi:hypothetical protein
MGQVPCQVEDTVVCCAQGPVGGQGHGAGRRANGGFTCTVMDSEFTDAHWRSLRDLCDARLGKRSVPAHVEYIGAADVAVVAKNKRSVKMLRPFFVFLVNPTFRCRMCAAGEAQAQCMISWLTMTM